MLTTMSVRAYAAQLAAKEPTPGGGSAAALVGALAAALGEMTANFTRDKDGWEQVALALEELTAIRDHLLGLADRDADAYASVGAAYALPRTDEVQKAARREAIEEALGVAAQVPLEVVKKVGEVVRLLPVLVQHGNKNLISDVGVAAAFARAALVAAWLNVEVNLSLMKNETHKQTARAAMFEAIREAEQTAIAVWNDSSKIVTDQVYPSKATDL